MPLASREALELAANPAGPSGVAVRQTVAEGFTADPGLAYPATALEAAGNLAHLWHADLSDPASSWGSADQRAWNDAPSRWLVDSEVAPGREASGAVRVGLADAGHLLYDQYTETAGRTLFSAVAEATLSAAWMSYDSASAEALAQFYFVQALAHAQAGGDRPLGASILEAMSHQATYLGRYGEAANLARAARTGTQGIATPTLVPHFHTMEARALAHIGDAKSCDRALADAVRECERRTPEHGPEWIHYFNDAALSAKFGHRLRDMGRPTEVAGYANASVAAVDDVTFLRSDFFVTFILADAHTDAGEIELHAGWL